VRLEIPAKLVPLAQHLRSGKYRHIIIRGGRGSGKSWSIGRVLIAQALSEPLRVLCLRETQKSIKESSLRLLDDQASTMGFGAGFDVQNTQILCTVQQSEFQFAGLREHTADSIKSYEGFDIAWVEEAHSVSAKSANTLIPTLRKPGSIIIWSYNPDQEDDFVHQLAQSGRADVLVIDCNWVDNRWFPRELDIERLAMLAISPDLYDHIWNGKCRSRAGILFKRSWVKYYDRMPAQVNRYIASDYAGEPDADRPDDEPDFTEHGVFSVDSDFKLYATDWWWGQTSPDEWISQWSRLVRVHRPNVAFEEKGVILRSLNGAINRRMQDDKAFVVRTGLASAGSKLERAYGFAALMQQGMVLWPHPDKAPWVTRVIDQLCAFHGQGNQFDDAVDVCSLIARGLDDVIRAQAPPPPPAPPPKPFTVAAIDWAERQERDARASNQRSSL